MNIIAPIKLSVLIYNYKFGIYNIIKYEKGIESENNVYNLYIRYCIIFILFATVYLSPKAIEKFSRNSAKNQTVVASSKKELQQDAVFNSISNDMSQKIKNQLRLKTHLAKKIKISLDTLNKLELQLNTVVAKLTKCNKAGADLNARADLPSGWQGGSCITAYDRMNPGKALSCTDYTTPKSRILCKRNDALPFSSFKKYASITTADLKNTKIFKVNDVANNVKTIGQDYCGSSLQNSNLNPADWSGASCITTYDTSDPPNQIICTDDTIAKSAVVCTKNNSIPYYSPTNTLGAKYTYFAKLQIQVDNLNLIKALKVNTVLMNSKNLLYIIKANLATTPVSTYACPIDTTGPNWQYVYYGIKNIFGADLEQLPTDDGINVTEKGPTYTCDLFIVDINSTTDNQLYLLNTPTKIVKTTGLAADGVTPMTIYDPEKLYKTLKSGLPYVKLDMPSVAYAISPNFTSGTLLSYITPSQTINSVALPRTRVYFLLLNGWIIPIIYINVGAGTASYMVNYLYLGLTQLYCVTAQNYQDDLLLTSNINTTTETELAAALPWDISYIDGTNPTKNPLVSTYPLNRPRVVTQFVSNTVYYTHVYMNSVLYYAGGYDADGIAGDAPTMLGNNIVVPNWNHWVSSRSIVGYGTYVSAAHLAPTLSLINRSPPVTPTPILYNPNIYQYDIFLDSGSIHNLTVPPPSSLGTTPLGVTLKRRTPYSLHTFDGGEMYPRMFIHPNWKSYPPDTRLVFVAGSSMTQISQKSPGSDRTKLSDSAPSTLWIDTLKQQLLLPAGDTSIMRDLGIISFPMRARAAVDSLPINTYVEPFKSKKQNLSKNSIRFLKD